MIDNVLNLRKDGNEQPQSTCLRSNTPPLERPTKQSSLARKRTFGRFSETAAWQPWTLIVFLNQFASLRQTIHLTWRID